MKMFKGKKGQDAGVFDQLGALGIGIVVLAVVLVIAFVIVAQVQPQISDTITPTAVNDEAILSFSNTTRQVFSITEANAVAGSIACAGVSNFSVNGSLVATTDYTCTDLGIIYVGDFTDSDLSTNISVNYTYRLRSAGWNASVTLQDSAGDLPGWVPIIVITFIGSLILGIVHVLRKQS